MVTRPWAAKKQILKTKGEREMRKKGFTLIELLVVIAIIAMLLAILMPALGKVKKLAERLVCGTNVRGIATSCVMYSNDSDGSYPVQGGSAIPPIHALAFTTTDWALPAKDWTVGGDMSIGASLFLLIRYADISPKSFVCRSGEETVFDGDSPGTPPPQLRNCGILAALPSLITASPSFMSVMPIKDRIPIQLVPTIFQVQHQTRRKGQLLRTKTHTSKRSLASPL